MEERWIKLPYTHQKNSLLTIMDDFSHVSRIKLLLALEVCDELDDEDDRKFRLRQTLYTALWEFEDAVKNGFDTWLDDNLLVRHHAIMYHSSNEGECGHECKLCKGNYRWNR